MDAGVPVVQDMNDVDIGAESTDPKELGIMLPIEWCRNLQTPSVQSSCVLNFSTFRLGCIESGERKTSHSVSSRYSQQKCSSLAEFWKRTLLLIIAAVCVEYGRRHTWSAPQSFGGFQTYRLRRSRCWRTEETISVKGTLCDLFLFRHCRNCSMSRIFS